MLNNAHDLDEKAGEGDDADELQEQENYSSAQKLKLHLWL